jgi:hypothetical protein
MNANTGRGCRLSLSGVTRSSGEAPTSRQVFVRPILTLSPETLQRGAIPGLGTSSGLTTDTATRGATTVQHQTWETQSAFAAGQGSNLAVRVKCYEQAGGLNGETVDYAVALSLWVAPTINVDVYAQVRDQVQIRVPIRPR